MMAQQTHPIRPLGELAEIFAGVPNRKRKNPGDENQRLLSVNSLESESVNADAVYTAYVPGWAVGKAAVREGDVLLPSRSTSLRIGVVPHELEGTAISAALVGVRCGPKLDPRVLRAYLSHPCGQEAIHAVCITGTVQMNLTIKGLRVLPVPVPPLEVQRQMVEMLEAANEAYHTALQAAHDRLRVAREVVVNNMFGRPAGRANS